MSMSISHLLIASLNSRTETGDDDSLTHDKVLSWNRLVSEQRGALKDRIDWRTSLNSEAEIPATRPMREVARGIVIASEARQSSNEMSAQRPLRCSRDRSRPLNWRVACGSSQRRRAENGLMVQNNAAIETRGRILRSVI